MSRLRSFFGAYYAYVFLFDFILCYAIYTAYFELRGLSYFEIGMLLAFWSGSALVLELFTGALSDALDRRILLIIAPIFKILTFVCWAQADGDVWIYGWGFLMWSIGQSLLSGTREALLFERLEAEGQSDDYDKHYGRSEAVESLGVAAGLLLGGFVAAQSMELSIWLSIPPLLAGAIVAFWLKDGRRDEDMDDNDDESGYFVHFRNCFVALRDHVDLRFLVAYIAIGLILFEELEEFDQLFYAAVDLPIVWFGIVGAIALGLRALVTSQAYRLAKFSALTPALPWALPAISGVGMIIAAFGGTILWVVILELAYLVSVPAAILSEARFQAIMPGKSRATLTSALYFAQNVMALIVALVFGYVANVVGILPAYGWAGVALLPISAWVWWRQKRGFRAF